MRANEIMHHIEAVFAEKGRLVHLLQTPSCQLYAFLPTTLCGLRFPMRPLSVPAFSSMTALTRVGLPDARASLTARDSSSGDVAYTPTPPKASIILS